MFDLYESSGYLNTRGIFNSGYPFVFEIGGRGIGKTYGAIKYGLENGIKFGLMRRTATELEIVSSPISPVISIGQDCGMGGIEPKSSKHYTEFVRDGKTLAYGFALSTIASLRGFSAEDLEWLIFDEFITEPHVRKMKSEGMAFANAVETISRNRELQGREPLKVHLLANTFNLDSPILNYFELVDDIARAQEDGKEILEYPDRGIMVVLPQKSRISEMKKETSLYRALKGSDFEELAIKSVFRLPRAVVKNPNLREYNPMGVLEGLYIYRHKSQPWYHICPTKQGTPQKLKVKQLYNTLPGLLLAITRDRITFDSLQTYYKFAEVVGLDT